MCQLLFWNSKLRAIEMSAGDKGSNLYNIKVWVTANNIYADGKCSNLYNLKVWIGLYRPLDDFTNPK